MSARSTEIAVLRDLARRCHNGAEDPYQEFYDLGASPMLDRLADALEALPPIVDTRCPCCNGWMSEVCTWCRNGSCTNAPCTGKPMRPSRRRDGAPAPAPATQDWRDEEMGS